MKGAYFKEEVGKCCFIHLKACDGVQRMSTLSGILPHLYTLGMAASGHFDQPRKQLQQTVVS